MIRASDWNNRYGRPRRRRRRHGCLTRLVTTVVVLAVLVGFFWWQQNGLSSETLSVPAAPDGFAGTRIAVVSDLHGKEFGEDNERLLDYIRDLETFLGTSVGNILPANVVSALSVGLYGMFLAVIIPAARKSKVILGVVAVSMGVSLLLASIPLFAQLAEGTRIILITVGISAGAALLFPVKEEKEVGHGA